MTDPRTFIVAETLRDGTSVSIRAIRPDDRRRVLEAFANLDRKSVFRRFFNYKTSLTDAELKQFTDVDDGRFLIQRASLARTVEELAALGL